ncbi:MAG: DUF5659 domain-containing protein [Candidatus Dojkabacteria bacterium]|nr:DUF5659 domain-containing protein [Candidatus Dojkabacteria bacterium]
MKNKDMYFTTYDLNLAAVCVASGLPLENLERNPHGKSLFFFSHSTQLDEVIRDYWRGKLRINPVELFNALKSIKNRMYSGYDDGNFS